MSVQARRPAPGGDTRALDDAQLALLEEEREFLLRSLDDLDAEFAAGDVDEVDYRALHDDYTRRAAGVIRAIETRKARIAAPARRSRARVLAWVAGVVAIGVVAGLLLGRATGGRGGGELSGDIRESSRTLLVEAQRAVAEGDTAAAIDLYGEALEQSPGNVEALSYRGWLHYRDGGDVAAALADLDEAVEIDPAYADARVFRASILLDEGDADAAAEDLAAYDATPSRPPMADQLLVSFRLRERVALARVEPVVLAEDADGDLDAAGLTATDLKLAAEQLLENGALTEAVVVIDAGLDRDPEDAALLALLGWIDGIVAQSSSTSAEQRALLEPRALERLARAIALDPELPDARVYRAILLARLDRADEAAEDLAVFCGAPQSPKLQEYVAAAGLSCGG